MKRALSPTPSLSLRLDHYEAARETGSGETGISFPRWRAFADGAGMVMFLMLLGAYLVVRL